MFDSLINRYVRHALTVGLGYVVAKGYLDPGLANQFTDVTVQVVVGAAGFFYVTHLSKLSDKLIQQAGKLF
jgi:hypothetical protein